MLKILFYKSRHCYIFLKFEHNWNIWKNCMTLTLVFPYKQSTSVLHRRVISITLFTHAVFIQATDRFN